MFFKNRVVPPKPASLVKLSARAAASSLGNHRALHRLPDSARAVEAGRSLGCLDGMAAAVGEAHASGRSTGRERKCMENPASVVATVHKRGGRIARRDAKKWKQRK